MSMWETVETTICDTLAAVVPGGSALLATVKGQTARDRKSMVASILREQLPAAYVVLTGRDSGDKTTRMSGSALVSVVLATGSQRGDDEVRIGSGEAAGLFELVEEVGSSLQDLAIDTDQTLLLVDERPIGGEEGVVVWEQRYELRRLAESSPPTFSGVALAGADSRVCVEIDAMTKATSSFSFPGIDGVFARDLGLRDRAIYWRGQLRAADDSSLNAIEAAFEDALAAGSCNTMVDAWGRSHDECVLQSFQRKGPRGRDAMTGRASQDFEARFVQLNR